MLEQLPDKFVQMLNYVPFVTLAIKGEPTPLTTRLIETGIMSVIAGLGSIYLAVPLLQKDIEVLNASVQRVDDRVEKIDQKVEKLREDLYAPRGGMK
ncbi:hypothetical protein [Methylocaldum sp.]|uniref:hypothetical protein n=1 Tax=Methylocaldum sp. TaxID=1969727 RepID=UPI002D75D233|nr:hypothetical protein [Methylocaldum sp.]HYE38155.1 hypothetical protein [Methylocaldum sp.]